MNFVKDNYKPPFWLFNGHLETIYPAMFRKVSMASFNEVEIETPDGDFLEFDHYQNGKKRIAILCHGLEGNSRRPYMLGMANAFLDHSYDVLAWNFRSCGSKMNRMPFYYHSGATYDLVTIIEYTIQLGVYEEIALVGFSMGGNLILKYLGEGKDVPDEVKSAVAISVPLDLKSGSAMISSSKNILYEKRFLRNLEDKIRRKAKLLPIETSHLQKIKCLKDFDDYYTGPLNGYQDANAYYHENSASRYLHAISTPSLILQAKNDSFLDASAFPEQNNYSSSVKWCVTARGGHVGFAQQGGRYFSEVTALSFSLKNSNLEEKTLS